jgi:hypothetical protein
VRNFKLLNDALVYHPSRGHGKRYLLPESLRSMVLEYYHSSTLSAYLGMTITLNRFAKVRRKFVLSSGDVRVAREPNQAQIPMWACIAAKW